MPATIRQCVDNALTVIGEVAGVGVQQYTEDVLKKGVERGFNLLFKKRPWAHYCKWTRVALDGTTGVITTDAFEQVLDFEDFLSVNPENQTRGLARWPHDKNPLGMTGTRARYFDSLHVDHANYVGRKLQIYPITSVGNIDVRARHYPRLLVEQNFDWEFTFYMDEDLLAYSGAYVILIGNDLNPSAAQVAKALMDDKYKVITGALADHEIAVESESSVPNEWYVR